MKKLSLISVLFLLSSFASANAQNLLPSDDSPYTAICIAAAESDAALAAKMEEYDVAKNDIHELTCNGTPLNRFARKYRNTDSSDFVKVFSFRESVSSSATSICIAAATSNEEYVRVKDELFNRMATSISGIECNNMPLRTFARRHGNTEFKI